MDLYLNFKSSVCFKNKDKRLPSQEINYIKSEYCIKVAFVKYKQAGKCFCCFCVDRLLFHFLTLIGILHAVATKLIAKGFQEQCITFNFIVVAHQNYLLSKLLVYLWYKTLAAWTKMCSTIYNLPLTAHWRCVDLFMKNLDFYVDYHLIWFIFLRSIFLSSFLESTILAISTYVITAHKRSCGKVIFLHV